jgi:UDP-N-acetylmuramate dehydrogenase
MSEAADRLLSDFGARMSNMAQAIGAPADLLPQIGAADANAENWVSLQDGRYRLSHQERGEVEVLAESADAEAILERIFDSATFDMATREEARARTAGQDVRRQIFQIQAALLEKLDPEWADRVRARHGETMKAHPLDDAPADWAEHLPAARGRIVRGEVLAPFTWFRVGGPADVLFLPADEQDLADFARELHHTIPLIIIGVGSNLLVRDGGVDGVVVRLGRPFAKVEPRGNNRIYAGAAALDAQVAKAAAAAGIAGLEFYSGIPGTIGGACTMNAGCYGSETKDVLIEAYAINRTTGETLTLSNAEMKFSYRHSYPGPGKTVLDGLIFTGALFEGTADDPAAISERMDAISARRETTQPIREKTGGSTFANPPGHSSWKLVDATGWRGKPFGGAMFSPLHANFLINTGEATAADIEGLGETVRRDVKEKLGVDLHWEIRRIGRPA